jgi:hypothetical protein
MINKRRVYRQVNKFGLICAYAEANCGVNNIVLLYKMRNNTIKVLYSAVARFDHVLIHAIFKR